MLRAGYVSCYGINDQAQLGRGTTGGSDRFINHSFSERVRGSGGAYLSGVTQIKGGGNHVCAVVNARVRCWGSNAGGQLGRGHSVSPQSRADVEVRQRVRSAPITGIVQVKAGLSHSCATTTTADVWCWGEWALGNGQLGGSSWAVKVSDRGWARDHVIVDLHLGVSHTSALSDRGEAWSWGYNASGVLGTGVDADTALPRRVVGLQGHGVSMGGSTFHTCVLTRELEVYCWGLNVRGQLGHGQGYGFGDEHHSNTARRVIGLP
jgi:alpha-tubulin suppressor-like RCC1 family protein